LPNLVGFFSIVVSILFEFNCYQLIELFISTSKNICFSSSVAQSLYFPSPFFIEYLFKDVVML